MSHKNKSADTRILVIDDETSMGEFMKIMLGKEGYCVTFETSAQHALQNFSDSQSDPQKRYDLMITDLMMPEMSGLDILTKAQKIDPDIDVIVMTAFGSIDTAVEALKKGAHDYVTKPFKVEEIKIAIKKAVENKKIKRENISLKDTIKSGFDSFIGNSPSIVKIKKHAAKAASSDVTVLITGESGTGKEVLARAIHAESRRANGPFLSINSAALPETLLESELFGHVKGSFTGAVKDKTGLFKASASGTFFLDEIGETSPTIQAKLLRVLEEREVTPVGATKAIPVDVRLIAATNAGLQEMVDQGTFRSDLFYRLNVFSLHIPPLRQRPDDIEILATHFIKRHCAKMKIDILSLSDDALEVLKSYGWPGNVRQLENILERTLMLTRGSVIEIDDLPEEILKAIESKPSLIQNITRKISVSPDLETMEKAYIHYVLHQTNWNKSKAAKILGIDLSTLYRKMDRYSIPKKP
jgi:DNA-binding NtrC family response regulator